MSKFSFISKMFGCDQSLTEQEKTTLLEELLVLTLSRVSRSDLDISNIEIDAIQSVLKEVVAADVSEQDIRKAAMSELYETAPLEKYVAKTAKNLNTEQRYVIASSLYKVISSDGKITLTEAEFFNNVVGVLDLSPIEMMGAKVDT